jgi:hypothetical protein
MDSGFMRCLITSVVLVWEPYFCVFLVCMLNIYIHAQCVLTCFKCKPGLYGSGSDFCSNFQCHKRKC